MSDSEDKSYVHRETAPAFVMGFRASFTEEICVIDFVDAPADNISRSICSVAVTKDHARKLLGILEEFVSD